MTILRPVPTPEAPFSRGTTGRSPTSFIPSGIFLPLLVDFCRYSNNYRLAMYPRIFRKKPGHRLREIG
jgi:hypothetical protein